MIGCVYPISASQLNGLFPGSQKDAARANWYTAAFLESEGLRIDDRRGVFFHHHKVSTKAAERLDWSAYLITGVSSVGGEVRHSLTKTHTCFFLAFLASKYARTVQLFRPVKNTRNLQGQIGIPYGIPNNIHSEGQSSGRTWLLPASVMNFSLSLAKFFTFTGSVRFTCFRVLRYGTSSMTTSSNRLWAGNSSFERKALIVFLASSMGGLPGIRSLQSMPEGLDFSPKVWP